MWVDTEPLTPGCGGSTQVEQRDQIGATALIRSTVPLPAGTLSYLFTDIEGSTRLWQAQQMEMPRGIARHDAILRGAVESNRGVVFRTVGDAVYAAFESARDALAAALAGQSALIEEAWPED